MKHLTVGLLQGDFRSAFHEKIPELRRHSNYRDTLGTRDFDHNQAVLLPLIRSAASDGADLVLTPESYLDGWSCDGGILTEVAVTLDGVYVSQLRAIAAELGLWICAGLFERDGDRVYNSAILIDSDGSIAFVYRKTHETPDVLERMPYHLGDELPVVETPWGRLGILICHDRWYPEAYRTLRRKGAELILNPAASATFWPGHTYHDIHLCSLRSHAYSNGLFLACCNAGNHGGHSVIVAPDGTIAAQAEQDEGVLVSRLDPSAHSSYDFISRLRPSVYQSGRNS